MMFIFFFVAESMLLGKTKSADRCTESREQLRVLLLRSMANPSVLQVLVTEHNRGSGMFENRHLYPCAEGVDGLTKLVESTILESRIRLSTTSTAAPFVLAETRLVAGEGAPNRNVLFAIERKLEEVVVVEERKRSSSSSSSKRGSGQGLLIFTVDKTEQTLFFPLER